MMSSKTTKVGTAGLLSGAIAFKEWRGSRRRGARIPETLWRVAVSLAEDHGVSKTSQALRLDYYALKKRRDLRRSSSKRTDSDGGKRPRFVEISGSSLSSPATCSIEMESGIGSTSHVRMKLEIGNTPLADLTALVQQIWASSR